MLLHSLDSNTLRAAIVTVTETVSGGCRDGKLALAVQARGRVWA